jgi:hypothetical protein
MAATERAVSTAPADSMEAAAAVLAAWAAGVARAAQAGPEAQAG